MRNLIATIIAFLVIFGATAQPHAEYNIVRSKPVDDLILQVSLDEKNGIVLSTSPIGYGWFTVTNKGILLNLPKDECLCYAQMFDSNSNAVELHWNFRNSGKRFFDLKYPSPEQSWDDIENIVRIRPAHGTQSAAADVVSAGRKSCEGRQLPCFDEIFQIQKPGLYKVRLQFQAYKPIYKGGRNVMYKLERFDPVEFTVTKK
jgi:hypothetical protein